MRTVITTVVFVLVCSGQVSAWESAEVLPTAVLERMSVEELAQETFGACIAVYVSRSLLDGKPLQGLTRTWVQQLATDAEAYLAMLRQIARQKLEGRDPWFGLYLDQLLLDQGYLTAGSAPCVNLTRDATERQRRAQERRRKAPQTLELPPASPSPD